MWDPRSSLCASAVACLLVVTRPASAQSGPAQTTWELDLHVGAATVTQPTDGRFLLPDPGPTVTVIPVNGPPGYSWRRVPSWYFGDGALLFRQSNAASPFSPVDIVPLDAMLTRASAHRASGAAYGVRLRRSVAGRFGIEVGVDVVDANLEFTDEARAAIEQSRSTFEAAWRYVFDSEFFDEAEVSSIASFDPGSGGQVFTTVAVDYVLLERATDIISVVAGIGRITDVGDSPSVTLTGHYRGTFFDRYARFDETDRVTVRVETRDAATVTFLGARWTRWLTARWGIRADARLSFSANSVTLKVDASPERVLAGTTGFGVFINGGDPSVSIISGKDFAGWSSLSGDPVPSFTTFTGSGRHRCVSVTVGASVRF